MKSHFLLAIVPFAFNISAAIGSNFDPEIANAIVGNYQITKCTMTAGSNSDPCADLKSIEFSISPSNKTTLVMAEAFVDSTHFAYLGHENHSVPPSGTWSTAVDYQKINSSYVVLGNLRRFADNSVTGLWDYRMTVSLFLKGEELRISRDEISSDSWDGPATKRRSYIIIAKKIQ